MNANLIQTGSLAGIFILVTALVDRGLLAGDDDGYLKYRENITTLSGKTYAAVRLVKVDPNGLLFRHRGGIAKVTFDDLDTGFREFYGYDPETVAQFERGHSGEPEEPAPGAEPAAMIAADDPEIVLTFRTRTRVHLPSRRPFADTGMACGGTPWFSHWARFHPGLAYARFPCRQLAERDFLISSGILPVPTGVFVHRWYR